MSSKRLTMDELKRLKQLQTKNKHLPILDDLARSAVIYK